MKPKCIYRDYHIVAMSSPTGNGGYQSRAAVLTLAGSRTQTQRFLDSSVFDSEDAADSFAIEEAKSWVDAELRRPVLSTNFVSFSVEG